MGCSCPQRLPQPALTCTLYLLPCPNLRGINDEAQFRALVSCMIDAGKGKVGTVNITTGGFPATSSGDSDIDALLGLPSQCVAPIIFILSGSEDKWFSVTGAEAS